MNHTLIGYVLGYTQKTANGPTYQPAPTGAEKAEFAAKTNASRKKAPAKSTLAKSQVPGDKALPGSEAPRIDERQRMIADLSE